jgi:hypothetical protein
MCVSVYAHVYWWPGLNCLFSFRFPSVRFWFVVVMTGSKLIFVWVCPQCFFWCQLFGLHVVRYPFWHERSWYFGIMLFDVRSSYSSPVCAYSLCSLNGIFVSITWFFLRSFVSWITMVYLPSNRCYLSCRILCECFSPLVLLVVAVCCFGCLGFN